MASNDIYIFSPKLDQARFVAHLFRKYYPKSRIIGLLLPGERKSSSWVYDGFQAITDSWDPPDGIVVPTGTLSTKFMLQRGDINLGNIYMSERNLLVYEKRQFFNLAMKLGIIVPETVYDYLEIKSYPTFYKEDRELGGGRRGIAYSEKDLPFDKGGLLFQEYIDSIGTYGVSFLAKEGKLCVSHVHFERLSYPIAGGSAAVIEDFFDNRLTVYTTALVKELSYSGWGLAEFKYSSLHNDFVLMEINSKLWASCAFSFAKQPLFAEELFGIRMGYNKHTRFVYLSRIVRRGPIRFLSSLPYFFGAYLLP